MKETLEAKKQRTSTTGTGQGWRQSEALDSKSDSYQLGRIRAREEERTTTTAGSERYTTSALTPGGDNKNREREEKR
jgi:hypothetical protein